MYSKFAVTDTIIFKQKVLGWLKQFDTFCFLDSNLYPGNYELLVGAGVMRRYEASGVTALNGFQNFIDKKPAWLFGHLGYELATTERAGLSEKKDLLSFPDICFFEPEIVLQLQCNELQITAGSPEAIFRSIEQQVVAAQPEKQAPLEIKNRISREEYIATIDHLKNHIQRGDCYEINFCQEFFSENVLADPFLLFANLNKISPNPFAACYKLQDKWLLCASPERFIKKGGAAIISQPIKGTLPRNQAANNAARERDQLLHSKKDRAENVMVVDLVRNDLARICEEGSVKVDELFGIYSFPQLHQMISTVSGTLKKQADFTDIINATFPMGSMTGAPKIKVMQLIDQYEKSKRGIFSGALGYINPENDFDFNVVIRSIMYNQTSRYLSFQTGGGITIYCDAEKEWEECLLKASAIKKILGG
ncbi:MAG: anthranilate synthase component I family protein [Niabella sp.]